LLEYEQKFDNNTMDLLVNFINQLQQPVCLIAHNGDKFDFPILKKYCDELKRSLPGSLHCCDSLPVFRKIDEKFEENTRTMINGVKLSTWQKLDDKEAHLMDLEILDIHNAIENSINDNDQKEFEINSAPIEQLEDQFVKIEANQDPRSLQVINESTPNKPTQPYSANPHSKTNGETSRKRPNDVLRRELFPSTSNASQLSQQSNSSQSNATKRKYSLREIYFRFFNEYPNNSHDAEGDVVALMKCALARKEQFLEVANSMAKPFCDF
jgi:hypothetical protein